VLGTPSKIDRGVADAAPSFPRARISQADCHGGRAAGDQQRCIDRQASALVGKDSGAWQPPPDLPPRS